jgi:hypothetical protein
MIFHINVLIVVGFVYRVEQHVANNGVEYDPINIENDLAFGAQLSQP